MRKRKIKRCKHGCEIGGGDKKEIDLIDYSACDCCDELMHHNSVRVGYFVMKDGRTLCLVCVKTENPKNINQ
jgi:hypothetical protein